ncbi:unnamed protein product [Hermetia illucens]|uniref:RRM domain-containing protein n=1 Tax=Hermetia illucens TaxID=343691 RepID=A0A7R8Z1E8_HERIL|nr:eukaryotic translation initiation factor 4B isoform X2 [Hermetia illucens]CAD7091848.1 unnamed protein product [Hermetia illucens]
MASTGKKGKKSKGVVVSLQSFLANENSQPGLTQVAKKVRNRPDESDEEDNHSLPQIYQLPTAPRAARYLDEDAVPHKPPFLAYLSNLPFDLHDEDLYDFFNGMNIVSIRLPREDGEQGRLRGFGYIEFESRDELIDAVSLPDPQIRNRRIRIDVSNENDNRRGGMSRSRYDGFGGGNRDDSGSWRREPNDNRDEGRRGGYGYNRDRQRDNSNEGGSWRAAERPNTDSSPRRGGYGDGFRDRGDRGFGRRDDYRDRRPPPPPAEDERPKLNLKPRTLPLPEIKATEDDKSDGEEKSSTPEPPPKPKPAGVAPEKVFGSAKPVDTAAREKEIEERLERERLEKLRIQEEEEQRREEEKKDDGAEDNAREKDEKEDREARSWRKREDDVRQDGDRNNRKWSPDRRGPPRRPDDRRMGSGQPRDYRDNGPRRDYRDNRDNRGSDRDRDYNRDRDRDRGSTNYNKDNKITSRDSRPPPTPQARDDKARREPRPDRPMPKYQPPQGGPMLTNSNKYSGLLDDDDASE